MRLRPALAAACLLGLLGSAAPAVAKTTVHVSGRVLDGAGKPVRGARVTFLLPVDRSGTSQFTCFEATKEPACREHSVAATTDANGRYRLPVKLSSPLAAPLKHTLTVVDRGGSASLPPAKTQMYVYFARKDIDNVNVRLWRGRSSVARGADGTRTLHVDPLTTAYGTLYTKGARAELLQNGAVAWTYIDVKADREVDPRTVEAGTNGIRAVDTAIVGAHVVTYWSPGYSVKDGLKPLSRGRPCSAYGRDDALLKLAGCRFTDGKLATTIDIKYQLAGNKACTSGSLCDHPRWVMVDLGGTRTVDAVVTRGCDPGDAEVSLEGSVYVPFQKSDDAENGVFAGLVPLPARYVRVDLGRCPFSVTELSVFEPA